MTSLDTRSPARRARPSRVLTGLTSIAASAAIVAAGVGAGAADAGNGPYDLPVVQCAPGQTAVPSDIGDSADCTAASPSIIAKVGDTLIGAVLPGLGISLADLNTASAISLAPLLGDMYPGAATIAGTGLASAFASGGTANATADAFLSAAISIGALGSQADSHALGGLGLAVGAGVGGASANALPAGIALAFGLGETASATALGGVAAATGVLDGVAGVPDPAQSTVICTALYGRAQVTDGETGANYSSCTSLAFLFQKSQQGEGPVVYSIKNPFSLELTAPLAPMSSLLDLVGALGVETPFPPAVTDILMGKIIPTFTQDLVRVVMTDGGPKLETDLFGKSDAPSAPAPTLASATVSDPVDDEQASAESVSAVTEASATPEVDESDDEPAAGTAPVADPEPEADVDTAPEVSEEASATESEVSDPASAESSADAAPGDDSASIA
ncbi:hypothetical protein [Gordonia neofelifaecis]|uniref:PE-PPE domain-containing protein n=1 Tax=Gordonia neofelifaecis NRRL B-59395 TaxID=644548 RepID=F1YJR5_9ACTN|nr:hypothetical protein [Gordonia neofelifaecis]EGD54997.1 hypothetical protein SCNU_10726 [Gordonia neofelifaecis NRRL B-59395]